MNSRPIAPVRASRLLLVVMLLGLLRTDVCHAVSLLDEILAASTSLAESRFADDLGGLRQRSIREAAFTLALQSAIWHRKRALGEELEAIAPILARIYDLGRITMHMGRLLPPVIEEAGAAMRLRSDDEASASALSWRILRPARLVSLPPTWRDYLIGTNPEPGRPHPAVLPKDDGERGIWRSGALEGWRAGIEEADAMLRERIAALERDYTGMLRFKRLAYQGIVEVPMLAEGELGIVVDGNRLSVDERVLRIQRPTQFNRDFEAWTARPIPTNR